MNNSRFDFLPTELLESGINLKSIGVASIAWNFQQAINVIEYLHNHGYTILGGDVYAYVGSSIKTTYDNWYHNETETENDRKNGRKKQWTTFPCINYGMEIIISMTLFFHVIDFSNKIAG